MTFNLTAPPQTLHESVFVAPGATVLGDVSIGEDSGVWFGAVIRGDTERITIGNRTNVQDLCVIHADPGLPCTIGDGVTLGHGAIVHGAAVHDNVMIGIRATVLNGATIGAGSIVAAGSIVTEGTEVPPDSLVMGVPGKVVRTVSDEQRQRIQSAAEHYVSAAKAYRSSETLAD